MSLAATKKNHFNLSTYTPYQVFIKALYEFFKEETEIEESKNSAIDLASFQQQGYQQALKLLERHQGVMVADSVGLGKTYIALRLIEHRLNNKIAGHIPRILIVCPAQLRDLMWRKKLDEFSFEADILSQEEISRVNFDIRPYIKHDLVIVDESHNFRNCGTNRYRNLQKLMSSGKANKQIVLLTATPINNSIYDLYHQILLLTRNSETYYRHWGIRNLKSYFKSVENGKSDISELLLQTMVKRSRQDVILRQQAGDKSEIAGQEIHFPKRKLDEHKLTYNFEESFQGLYAGIADQIDQMQLAPYNIRAFKKKKNQEDKAQVKRNEALVALMKTLYLKRLESSLIAFENTINYQMQFQKRFDEYLNQGQLLESKVFRKIVAAEIDEAEKTEIQDFISSLQEIDPKDYRTDELQQAISSDLETLKDILKKLKQIKLAVEKKEDYDRKLAAFKKFLLNHVKGQKILVFSYFKDTANYLHEELLKDSNWLKLMQTNNRTLFIDCITGETNSKQRQEKVKSFAPKANCKDEKELQHYLSKEIDILICTDVLSEGQNLQDAGTIVNYDLHWNPVRMIQRAGRIDRLGTEYESLFIYNCFPEEGLEKLLGLVKKLQQKISSINETVGLDGSILGETISEKSLNELRRLKQAETEADKAAILAELEQATDLVSLDEMRFPLVEFVQEKGKKAAENIPDGIFSTRQNIQNIDGVFIAFRVKNRLFWQFYPRLNGTISTLTQNCITDKRKIFNWLKCKPEEFLNSDEIKPVAFDSTIFEILEAAVQNLLDELNPEKVSAQMPQKLPKWLQKIDYALSQISTAESSEKQRVHKVITTFPHLRNYQREIQSIWDKYLKLRDLNTLLSELDDLFGERELYSQISKVEDVSLLELLKKEDIELICYQWFKPKHSAFQFSEGQNRL